MRFSALVISLFALTLGACGDKDGDDSTGDDTAKTDDSPTCDFTADCTTFCTDAVLTCPDQYTDSGTCMEICNGFADGCDGDTSGNTLACRTYHLGAAATDAATHCPHVAQDGGGVCVD